LFRFPLGEDLFADGLSEIDIDGRSWRKNVQTQTLQFTQDDLILY